MEITTITEKGQATIPAKFRKEMGLKPGDRVIFQKLDNGDIVIKPVPLKDKDWNRFIAHTLKDELNSSADDAAYGDL